MVAERVCEHCGESYAGTAWHETGACLIALTRLVRSLRAEVEAHRLSEATWRRRFREAIGATDETE